MYKIIKPLLTTLSICLFLSGCQSQAEPKKVDNKKEAEAQNTNDKDTAEEATTETVETQALPTTLEDVINYPVGEFSAENITVQDQAVKDELASYQSISENADEAELGKLLEKLYSLYKREYEDPRAILTGQDIKAPKGESEKTEEQKTIVNVEIILDSSGSMAAKMGGKTRMELAKKSIKDFAASLSKEANIGLRVYGHKGSSSDSDKKISCSSNELVYDIQPYSKEDLNKALSKFSAKGWTPLAQALTEAQEDLSSYKGKNYKNIIYVVSDGIETCDGDPIAAAKSLKDSEISPLVNIIGFDLKNKDQKQLKAIAKAAGGSYTNVKNQAQLQNEFGKAAKETMKWLTWSSKEKMDALVNKSNQEMDVYVTASKWSQNFMSEENRIKFSLNELEMNGKITKEQKAALDEKVGLYYANQKEQLKQLETVLVDTLDQDLEQVLEKIDQIYKENVSPN